MYEPLITLTVYNKQGKFTNMYIVGQIVINCETGDIGAITNFIRRSYDNCKTFHTFVEINGVDEWEHTIVRSING